VAVTRAALAQQYSNATGLDYQVALGQLNAENSSHPTNPLGVRCGNSKGSGLEVGCDRSGFAVYRSSSDGIRGAAWLLMHGSHYGGVRQAIASGTPADQRLALINSGWAAGGYHGGTGFSAAGISGSAPATVGVSVPTSRQPSVRLATAAAPASSGTAAGTATLDKLLGLPASTPIDVTNIKMLDQRVGDLEAQGTISHAVAQGILQQIGYAGVQSAHGLRRTLGSIDVDLSTGNGPLSDVFGSLFGWVPGTLANVAVLVTVLGLGYLGVRKLLG
jgi:hypothetical protein